MRKSITRTITETTIKSANIKFENGQAVVTPNEPLVVSGTLTEEKALKAVRKAYGEASQVTEITSVDELYEISVEDFMKHAKKVVAEKEGTDAN